MNNKIIVIGIIFVLLFTVNFNLNNSHASLNMLYQASIILVNNQNVSTPNPFQQMIKLNESNYKGYMIYNGSFANFEFVYGNGTVIPAWIESNNSGILTVWLKIHSIPASSSITIYIDFVSLTTNLLSSSGATGIGEAPQLSPTYGQYDNGASVFNFYDNFSGTSLNTSKWAIVSAPPSGVITVNNGVSIINTQNNIYYVSSAPFIAPYVIDMGGILGITADDGPWFDLESTTSTANTGYLWATRGSNFGQNDQVLTDSNGSYSIFASASGYSGGSNFTVYTLEDIGGSSGTIDTFVNYNFWFSGISITFTHSGYFSPFRHYNPNTPATTLYWVRVRAYPLNGVMPSVSFGTLSPITKVSKIEKMNIHAKIYALNLSLPEEWGVYGFLNYTIYGNNYSIPVSNLTNNYYLNLSISYNFSVTNNTTLQYNLSLYAYKLQDYIAINHLNYRGRLNVITTQKEYNITLNDSIIKFENINNFYYFWDNYGYKIIGTIIIIGLFLFFISRLRRMR